MSVHFNRNGNLATLTAISHVNIKEGSLVLKTVDTQIGPKGNLNGELSISLNGQPLLISKTCKKPDSDGCGCGCRGTKKCKCSTKPKLQVFNRTMVNQLRGSITLLFNRLRKELLAFIKKHPNFAPNLPCFITLAVCRVTEARVIASCRLSGKSMLECTMEGETFYNMCKGDC